jgi:hypothetical protein
MMDYKLWIMDYWFWFGLAFMAISALMYYFVYYSPVQQEDWEKIPTLEEYLLTHPECKTSDDENAKCYACGSEKVTFQPSTSLQDPKYKHSCFSCGRNLFKIK